MPVRPARILRNLRLVLGNFMDVIRRRHIRQRGMRPGVVPYFHPCGPPHAQRRMRIGIVVQIHSGHESIDALKVIRQQFLCEARGNGFPSIIVGQAACRGKIVKCQRHDRMLLQLNFSRRLLLRARHSRSKRLRAHRAQSHHYHPNQPTTLHIFDCL